VNELEPGIFWMPPSHETDRPALVAVAGSRSSLMIDAGSSEHHARSFLQGLEDCNAPLPETVVLTHAHWDHVFGASAIDASLIASELTARELQVMAAYAWDDAAIDRRVQAGLEIPFCRDMMKAELTAEQRENLTIRVPDVTFATEHEIDLGDRVVQVIHVGGDHAADSSIVVVRGVVAILGDCIYHNLHCEPNYYTRRCMFPLLEKLLALDVRWFVPGHDDMPMSRVEFTAMAETLRTAGGLVALHGMDDEAIRDAGGATEAELHDAVRKFQAGLNREPA